MNEPIWKSCPSWPSYEVSEKGDIRRVVKAYGFIGDRKPYLNSNGRLMIVMRDGPKKKACHISRLVAEAFIGMAPSDKHQCAHNDGDKINNHYTNLRWATVSENQMDRVQHGTSNRGERFGRSRLTTKDVLAIKKELIDGVKPRELAERFNVAETTIKSIKSGKSWSWLSLACKQERRPFPAKIEVQAPQGELLEQAS